MIDAAFWIAVVTIVNVALVWPAARKTFAVGVVRAGFELASETTAPPPTLARASVSRESDSAVVGVTVKIVVLLVPP